MFMVRVRRIELRSQVWKTCILTAVLHPRAMYYIITFVYNKSMGRLFDRFSTNSTQNDAMHSSGLIGRPQIGGRVIKRSFRQRLAISRKHVGAYDDAEVRHSYRRSWRDQQIANTNDDDDNNDDKQNNPTQVLNSRVSGASSPAEAKRMSQQTSSAPSSRANPTTETIKTPRDRYPFNR